MKGCQSGGKGNFLVSGEYPERFTELEKWGARLLFTSPDQRLPEPVRYHPDLQVCKLPPETLFVLKKSPLLLEDSLLDQLPKPLETANTPEARYPKDVLCSAAPFGNYLLGNPQTLDPAILKKAKEKNYSLLSVRQGYAACAVCKVTEYAAITSDLGVYQALKRKKEFELLLIRPGFIQLPGYDTGFLGGCCGKLDDHLIAFTGSLNSHPDKENIKSFLENLHIDLLELSEEPLLDTGGIIRL